MNRKQKIIISVTGIFLAALILMGLTYAYFLTQIKGNTNNKSISVTTANLILTYGDGNGVLETGDKLRPGNSVNFKTASGTTVNEKTFTVTNSGDNTSYVVIVDNVNVTPEPFESNDFRYTLTCSSSDSNKCDGTTDSIFPLKNQSILVGNKIAAGTTHTYTLTMEYKETGKNQSNDMGKTITARINIEDIRRLDNPYKDNTNSLAYNIINNSVLGSNGTTLLPTADIPVAQDIARYYGDFVYQGDYWYYYLSIQDYADLKGKKASICTNDMIGSYFNEDGFTYPTDIIKGCDISGKPILNGYLDEYETSLITSQDDLGTSYVYRGNVSDNYVNFAGVCWRIVRIDGLGNIKLILEDQDSECASSNGNWNIPASNGTSITMNGEEPYTTGNFGYEIKNVDSDSSNEYIMNYLNPGEESKDTAMVNAFKYFQTKTLTDKVSSKYNNKTLSDYLVSGSWCLGDKAYKQSGAGGSYEYTLLNNYDYSENMYYDSYVRLYGNNKDGYNPTLKCNGTVMESFNDSTPMYVATLTADEIVFAGGSLKKENLNFYLFNEFDGFYHMWFLSPAHYFYDSDIVFGLKLVGDLYSAPVSGDMDGAFRPAINLKSSVEILSGGNGTKDNPYVIK